MRLLAVFVLSLALLLLNASPVLSLEKPEEELAEVGIKPIMGNKLKFDLLFKDENGVEKPLADFILPGKPVLLLPVYYHCPQLCGEVLAQVTDSINKLGLFMGVDYSFLTVSFDPTEGTELARKRADHFWNLYLEPIKAREHWHFLTGSPENVKTLMTGLGFSYRKDGMEFAHSTALYVLTSQGVISQYFTGIEFPPRDIRLSLVEASEGKIGSLLDHALLFCFRFDPTKGRYTWAVLGLLKVVGVITILLLGGLILGLRRKEKAPNAA